MKRLAIVSATALVALVAFDDGWSQPPSEGGVAAAARNASSSSTDRDAIVESAAAFDAAYNAHDAESAAGLFAEGAEFLDEEGRITGREAIRGAFADLFARFPETTLRTAVDDVRFPAPDMAIESGRTYAVHVPEGPEVERYYEAVHVRRDDGWQIASVREEPADPAVSPAEALAALGWLVGDWIDESDDSTVETRCRWSDDGNWLIQDYTVHLHGGPEMTGTQRIGWDASRRQVRSWSFDSEGGHLEADWTFDGERWTAQVNGVAGDGAIGTGTRLLTPLGSDAYLLESLHRVLDGESLPDSEVTVVRRPPEVETAETDPADGPSDGDADTQPE